ncbi:hypothetical protein GCM10022215_24170 [Nocardioides fonticola]|uniref:DUF3168 domain-containing protein n=1 Tax=Nocardioides fonticola TaxID=450363 RepID=A0ABP7XJU4_9ACTN
MVTAPGTDVLEHYLDAEQALSEQLAPWKVFRFGEVPGADGTPSEVDVVETPAMYALIDIQRDPVTARRLTGGAGRSRWVLSVRGVGGTVAEAEWILTRATVALEETRLSVDGRRTTPLQLDDSRSVRPDDGRFSGLRSWTYVL